MRRTDSLLLLIAWFPTASALATPAETAEEILTQTGVRGGLVLHLGCGDGSLTAELGRDEHTLVLGLDTDPAAVATARRHIQSLGRYGRIAVDAHDGRTLPLIDNLVTLVVAERTAVSQAEILRVLHPFGAAWIGGNQLVKPLPHDVDEWTHFLRGADNNAVARDRLVGPPRHMQFQAAPLWSRHHDRLASISAMVAARGRVFAISDRGPLFDPDEPAQWEVSARNAFNGVFLWSRPLGTWADYLRRFRSGPVQLQRLLVAEGDRVFVTLGLDEPISVLDAASGETIAVLDESRHAEEFVWEAGVLFVQIGQGGAEQASLAQLERRGGPALDYRATKRIKAIDPLTGNALWHWPADGTAEIMPQTLAVSGGGVFCQESGETMCLDAGSGQLRWRTQLAAPPQAAEPSASAAGKRRDKPGKAKAKAAEAPSGRAPGWAYATLVVHDGVVLSCDGSTLRALDAASGEALWTCPAQTPFTKTPAVDVLVTNGIVWTSPDLDQGRDLRTGQVVSENKLSEELLTAGHHHRCYRNKATERYLIHGYRGLEFRDTQGDNHCRHNWIRGICQYGILPAHGMVYVPPHSCSCYPEAKLFGFWALKAAESSLDLAALAPSHALVKGPAYDAIQSAGFDPQGQLAPPQDWPMHRRDARRSGVLPLPVAANRELWSVPSAERLSAPVISAGTLLVAAASSHQVRAFDARTGEARWSYTAGGPVDSAPTVCGPLALFGSADGCVHALRLSDGEVAWRFRAAPEERRTVALGQLESLWPVHGSVLVAHGLVWFVAGRSSYLDGGLFLYALDPVSGEVQAAERCQSPPATATANEAGIAPDNFTQNTVDFKTIGSPDRSDAFSMAGNLADILVADDDAVYLRHKKLDRQLRPVAEWTHHLFSTSSLLDASESYRAHWFYGNGDFSRLPVAYEWLTRGSYGGFSSPLGRFLVFDERHLWGSGWKDLALYRTEIAGIDERLAKDFPRDESRIVYTRLADSLPIHPRAMIKAGDVLYLAGYPAGSTIPHPEGEPIRDRGILLQIDAEDGKLLAQRELPAPPVFDGISAADRRLYLALENGDLLCLGE